MNLLRLVPILLICLLATSVQAKSKEKDKDKAQPQTAAAPVTPAAPTTVAPTTEPAPVAAPSLLSAAPPKSNAEDYDGIHLRLKYGPSSSSQKLESDPGLSTTLPQTGGTWMGAEIQYNMADKNVRAFIKYDENTTKYQDLSNVTPNTTTVKHGVLEFGGSSQPWRNSSGMFRNAYVGLGYYFQHREADVTNPLLANGLDSSGPMIIFGTYDKFSSSVFYEFDAHLMYPNYTHESPAHTGFYSHGVVGDAGFKVVFPYTNLIDLAVGLQVRYTNFKYEGTDASPLGSGRGTKDATESVLETALPFELRFRF
jgi:hypothetical protein